MSRDSLLELDRTRTAIEQELNSILEYLNAPGMPGMNGPLVDPQGFPFPNLDLYKIREMRQRFHIRNNDYTAVMKQVEEQLAAYYGGTHSQSDVQQTRNEVAVAAISIARQPTVPFAYISEVTTDSPAFLAGLQVNDRVTKFGAVTIANHQNLSALAEEVKSHIGETLKVAVVRRNDVNEEMELELTVRPQRWAGPGVLGCRFMPISPT